MLSSVGLFGGTSSCFSRNRFIVLVPNFNSDGIVEWGVKNIIPIVLLVVGIGIIASARKGQMSQNAMTITNVMLGCIVIAGAGALLRVRGQHRQTSSSRSEPC